MGEVDCRKCGGALEGGVCRPCNAEARLLLLERRVGELENMSHVHAAFAPHTPFPPGEGALPDA